ncbi:MAG: MFS transporter, partial [bacterium]
VWLYIIASAVFTRYGQLLGLTKFEFGLLAALPFAASVIQVPVSYLVERFGHHKAVFVIGGMLHRATWVLIALIPMMLPHDLWAVGLLTLVFLSAALGSVPVPVWYTWMGELVPASIRGRYFSRRTQIGQVVGLAVTLAVGFLLDLAVKMGPMAVLETAMILMAVAGLMGMCDFLFFLPVRPPSKPQPDTRVAVKDMLFQPLADRNFRYFLGFTATMTFGTVFLGQFLWLYVFDVLKATNTRANSLLVLIPLIVTMISVSIWGRLMDRFGRKPVLIICGLMVVLGSIAWIFVTPTLMWPGYIMVVVATFAWPGIELANFNILLGMCESLRGRKYRMGYIVVFNMVGAIAGCSSGIFGGAIAEWLKDWHGTLLGFQLTYHGVLFIVSGGLRLAALAWLIGLVDERAYGARETLRYMANELFSNLQQAAAVPFRLAGLVGRWTYKLNPRRPSNRKRK